MKTILILYTELMPYNICVVEEFCSRGYTVHIVRKTEKCLTPYMPPFIPNVTMYDRSSFTYSTLLMKVYEIQPDIIWVAGWIDKVYCKVCEVYKSKKHIPVVASSDTQWRGGKQWLNVLFSPFRHKRWFSHIQIAGIWQYEYARRLGFSPSQILLPCLSANISLFDGVDVERKINSYPKNLLFVGRFAQEKNLPFLLEAWNSIQNRKEWTLTLIGNGPLKKVLEKEPDVIIKDFMSQDKIVDEMQNAGAFILPSVFEPWALVLHEAAAGGLPILASNCCGAVPYFVLENYNGHLFIPGDVSSISNAIQHLIDTPKEELIRMSYRSRELSKRITPELVANTLLSVI